MYSDILTIVWNFLLLTLPPTEHIRFKMALFIGQLLFWLLDLFGVRAQPGYNKTRAI